MDLLDMAILCVRLEALPDPGGIDDQDPDKLSAVMIVREEIERERRRQN